MEELQVIKIGGNVIDNPGNLDRFLIDFTTIPGPKILVHGGGKKASALLETMGIAPKMVDGRRITDEATLDVVTMVYAGLINKSIVSKLQANGCNASGFSGADGNIIEAVKRPVKKIDYGFAGDLFEGSVNIGFLSTLLEHQICPVLCAITHDKKGQLLNTNADTMATQVAIAMSKQYKTTLTYCFEKNGVLSDPEDDNAVIEEMNWDKYQDYKNNQIITDGMIPKLDNAFEAIREGVASIMVKHANNIANSFGTRLT